MNYNLNQNENKQKKASLKSLKKLYPYLKLEKKFILISLVFILLSSGLSLLSPILIGQTVDKYISNHNLKGVLIFGTLLLIIYLLSMLFSYFQTMVMGGVGQRVLYSLRDNIFQKLQSLPIAFFNQNKAGDLISRINNDTDKLNQFFSQSLMQFIGSVFLIIGSGIFLISLKPILGLAILAPAILILIFTKIISPWIARRNLINLNTVGELSAEIQESLGNFKVIIVFNRRDYFLEKFARINKQSYIHGIFASIANSIPNSVYGLFSNLAKLITLIFGIYLILRGHLTIGLLISFITYTTNFYNPLQQIAAIWASFQTAMAAWERISKVLILDNNLLQIIDIEDEKENNRNILVLEDVDFEYNSSKKVLHKINLSLEVGKTYALVGPTGGGKTTTASLIARLYDTSNGKIFLNGKDIRSFNDKERVNLIGFILQEPFLFLGTLKENILYGNDLYQEINDQELLKVLKEKGLFEILSRFKDGLNTKIDKNQNLSLGQRQLVAFLRAILREPKILILDEATANVDTITEQMLDKALNCLPKTTTKIIIAHRLNTIENADEIFFVNSGEIVKAGNMEEAVDLLLHKDRRS